MKELKKENIIVDIDFKRMLIKSSKYFIYYEKILQIRY